jgi:hypothetical protein
MKYNSIDQDKVFPSSNGIAIRIDHVSPLHYVRQDGSMFEISESNSGPLFQKYKLIVPRDNEPDYETCKECGQIHNELASRTYDNVPTSIDVIRELGKKKPLPIEVDRKS